MVKIKKEGIILEKTNHSFENTRGLNSSHIKGMDNHHLFYHAIEERENSTIGYCRLNGSVTVAERLNFLFNDSALNTEKPGLEDPGSVKIGAHYPFAILKNLKPLKKTPQQVFPLTTAEFRVYPPGIAWFGNSLINYFKCCHRGYKLNLVYRCL